MTNINDPRSLKGMYSRGSNNYGGVSKSPNPVGLNQHKFNPQKAAKLRRKKQEKKVNLAPIATMRRQI